MGNHNSAGFATANSPRESPRVHIESALKMLPKKKFKNFKQSLMQVEPHFPTRLVKLANYIDVTEMVMWKYVGIHAVYPILQVLEEIDQEQIANFLRYATGAVNLK